MKLSEFLWRFPWTQTILLSISMIGGHFIYLRAVEVSIQINMSGSEGQFYQQNPTQCAYWYSPNPLPCYIPMSDLLSVFLFGIIGGCIYLLGFKRRY
jgi:hypothetical protein